MLVLQRVDALVLLVLSVVEVLDEVVVVGTADSIGCAGVYGIVGGVDIGNEPEYCTSEGLKVLLLERVNSHIKSLRIARGRNFSVPNAT